MAAMKTFERRISKLEARMAEVRVPVRPAERIIVPCGETVREALAREGFPVEPDETIEAAMGRYGFTDQYPMIIRRIVEPGGLGSETGEAA